MTQHTPWPWSRNIPPASQYPVIFSGRNVHVAQVISRHCPASEVEANASLIAAAPELLAALKALADEARENLAGAADYLIDDAYEAIAKATGAA